jgi:hypothetical protein
VRTFIAVAFLVGINIFSSPALAGQEVSSAHRTKPGSVCGDESSGLPDFYYESVLTFIKPPEWEHGVIKVLVGGETKLGLWTDGKTFKLWTNKSEKKMHDVLFGLDESCKLPSDPKDAYKLLNINWESKELSASQFARLHREFSAALTKYNDKIQLRYSSIMAAHSTVLFLDATSYSVVYDNGYEHVQVLATKQEGYLDPMIAWVSRLRKLGENSFHRSIWSE